MSFFSRLFGKAASNQPLTLLGYAEVYAAAVRRAHPGAEVKLHAAASAAECRVEWRTPGGWDSQQFFGNYYARYLQNPGDLHGLVAAQLAEAEGIGAGPAPSDWQASLLPVVKTFAWHHATLAQLKAAGASQGNAIVTRPWIAELLVACVSDLPSSMSFVTAGDLASHGIDESTLHDVALANLARRLPDLAIEGGNGRFAARLDRNYDASMVLLLDRWRDRVDAAGDLVVAVPARDEVLMCPAGEPEIVASLAGMAASIANSSAYALTAQLLVWRNGQLAVLPGLPSN